MDRLRDVRYLIALGLFLLVLAAVPGGFYTVVAARGGDAPTDFYRVNRFTGSITFCRLTNCVRVGWSE